MATIPKRVSTALINSLSAGVVPRIGLEHIAVGREKEMAALAQDLDNMAQGGAAFRFIIGRYGAGKSFMLQLLRNYALQQGFVVADVDLSPERRLAGTNDQSVSTYRELMPRLSSKTRPDGGALIAILEGWINDIQNLVAKTTGMRPNDESFDNQVEAKIREVVKDIEGLVHGFDFANVIITYWRGYRLDDAQKKEAALRWLRGEFATKTEAKVALGERVSIIDDDSWYDYIKLLAKFVSDIGYKGLIIIVDEVVHLYKISHTLSRQKNYDKILTMFNDTRGGGVEHLGIFIGGTPQFLEDKRRGLYSDEALRSRLAKSRFLENGIQDTSEPVIHLKTLSVEDVYQILQRLIVVHAAHYNYKNTLKKGELQEFINEVANRLGAEELLTPREVVRDFVTLLNLHQQNSNLSFSQLINNSNFQPTAPLKNPDEQDSKFAEFTL
jgi:predicted house-cleaning noncanonical NTP pyrophosphatase (MazG superfamily)